MTTLNGQVIGQAHRATNALLQRRLDAAGLGFESWVVLNLLGGAGGTLESAALLERATTGLRVEGTIAGQALSALVEAGLVTVADGDAALTAAGQERWLAVVADIRDLTDRLYGDLPTDDLAVAGRVLTLVTERAARELTRS